MRIFGSFTAALLPLALGAANLLPSGGIVAISLRNQGTLQVYDLADPANPVLLKERSFENRLCNPDRPVFWKGRLIVLGGFAGILFEDRKAR